ncbi:MAG TPA: DUF1684 domain-containing protein [Opitutaceae bacterium]|nr:DUF1684 domain-containing protein [Opitutaceae bacterium]HND60467.1 DUF1684 domain-containing protein [Opitutaceae bacterium]
MSVIKWVCAGLALAAVAAAADQPAEPDDFTKSVLAWREQRVAKLTSADGWLTLIGLHFLKTGDNTVGTAGDNSIVMAKGPAHLGTFTLDQNSAVRAVFEPGIDARVDGEEELSADIRDDRREHPSVITVGNLTILLIDRGGKKALRVKDSESERRTHFLGIDYFPIDPSWRIEADWVAFDKPREVPIKNVLGNTSNALVLGKAVFKRDGQTIELLPIQESPDGPLFFVISDQTSGKETYAAARFLYAAPPEDGKVILDFNRAQNPPCAFTPFATCPLPPKENQMTIAVTAGEKKYRGLHE